MSSGTAIIQDSLEEIGAHSILAPANPEAIEKGRVKLNSMLQLWLSRGVRLGFTPLDAAGDELSEPGDARNAIVANLALELAPSFDNGKNVVSQILLGNAKRTFNLVRDIYRVVEIPTKIISSTTPIGSGNRVTFNQRIFKGRGGTVGN